MRVFVSGATGFIGGHLAAHLSRQGHEVKTLARPSSDLSLVKQLEIEAVTGDICDYASVERAMRGCEVVCHAAAIQSWGAPRQSTYENVNVKGTENIMRAAVAVGVCHVTYCSTVGVYGKLVEMPVNENTPLRTRGFYHRTKLKGEKLVSDYCERHGITGVTARLTPVFGPRELRWTRVFKDILDQKFRMIGSGATRYQIAHVDDIVRGLALCIETPPSQYDCYILSGEEQPTLMEIFHTIAEEGGVELRVKKFPAAPFKALAAVGHWSSEILSVQIPLMKKIDFFTRNRMYDISKAKNELGFVPRVSLRQNVRQTLAWYREAGYL